MGKLTPRQSMFVKEYLVDLNGTQAAIRAGYSKKTAGQQSEQLLKNLEIAAAVQAGMAKRAAKVEINADYVLARLAEIDRMDVLDIMNDDMALKPVSAWPSSWRRYLSGFDVAEMKDGQDAIGVLKKIKWPDKVKNLELLGKHVGVGAFTEKVQLSGPDSGPVQIGFKIIE
jgi:phage terminase small subunit